VPLFNPETRNTYPGEIDIIVTDRHLITGHIGNMYPLRKFFHELKNSEGKRRLHLDKTPAHLVHRLIEILLESCFPNLDHISKNLDEIEENVFNGREKEMVFEISVLKRDILNFRRTLKPQRAIIESLIQKDSPFIPNDLKVYFQDLIGINIRIWNILENNKEIIESLEDTNNSLLSNKLDMTMKVLTVFSAVMLPMTVYSSVLAMNTSIPLGNHPFSFWIHLAIMGAVSCLTVTVFRYKKWL
jgi:magnesium transporter